MQAFKATHRRGGRVIHVTLGQHFGIPIIQKSLSEHVINAAE